MEFQFDRSKHVFSFPRFEELIKDIVRFFNGTPIQPLPPVEKFEGAGVYAIYYIGKNKLYRSLHEINRLEYKQPIYVGKAVPAGWRQSRIGHSSSLELYRRLLDHYKSLTKAENLLSGDFLCRFMILEDGASSLAGSVESALIKHYKPLWNCLIDGFGNHDPGKGRYSQKISDWDILHPGREWALKCAASDITERHLSQMVKAFFASYRND